MKDYFKLFNLNVDIIGECLVFESSGESVLASKLYFPIDVARLKLLKMVCDKAEKYDKLIESKNIQRGG